MKKRSVPQPGRMVWVGPGAGRYEVTRRPVIYESSANVKQGGLVSYAADGVEIHRRAAEYVAQILNGASRSELPIQQRTKVELRINTKTAKALGLAVPPTLLFPADAALR